MTKTILLILLILGNTVFGQVYNFGQITKQITQLNDKHKYDKSIVLLQDIIDSNASTHYDKYQAYLLKYLTYKRLFNYYEAQNNLDLALKQGLKSPNKKEVEIRIAIEEIFLKFDLQRYDEVSELVLDINEENLNLVNPETRATYVAMLGVMDEHKGNLTEAIAKYDKAIKDLEKYSPKDLPNIYRKKIIVYGKLNNHDKAIEAFNKGLYYAKKYKTDIYVIIMYEALTQYYQLKEDWKNAFSSQQQVGKLRTKYDATNQSAKLNITEKEIITKRNELERRNEKNVRNFLVILSVILFSLIFVLFKLSTANKQKRILIENEMERMRDQLSSLSSEVNEKGENKLNINNYNLTPRQLEIIHLVEKGKTNKEIGAELFISENTVKYHLKIIYNILGIDNRSSIKLYDSFS